MQTTYACTADTWSGVSSNQGFQLLPAHTFPSAQKKKTDFCTWEEATQDMQLFICISKAKENSTETDRYYYCKVSISEETTYL